jgi:hypothetical protein
MFWLMRLSRTKDWTREIQGSDTGSIFRQDVDHESHSAKSNDSPHPTGGVIQKTEGHRQWNWVISSEIGHSDLPDQSSGQIGMASIPKKSVDITEFRCSLDRHSDAAHQTVAPMTLPLIMGDSKKITPEGKCQSHLLTG